MTAQDNLAGRLATKRKLGFLKTFDKRIEGLIREKERLQRSLGAPGALGKRAWLDSIERIVRGFVGAGPVYGINSVSDWAKETLAQIGRLRESEADPGEDELLWLSSITQEIKLLHSEAMAEIEEKFGIASIQETPSVIPPGTDTGLQGRTTLPPEEKTAALPPAGAPTRVAKLPQRQGAPADPSAEQNQITPITEDDIVTEVPEEVGSSPEPSPQAADEILDAGHTEAMPDRKPFSAPPVNTLPPAEAAPQQKPSRATSPQPPRPSLRQASRSSSPELPRPSSSPRSPIRADEEKALGEEPPAPTAQEMADLRPPPAEDESEKDKDQTVPILARDLNELPDGSFSESLPPASARGASGISRPWAVAMGITWMALLVSLYFNWRNYLAETPTGDRYVRAVGESTESSKPYPSGATDVSGVVPRIAIREAPVAKAEPDAAAEAPAAKAEPDAAAEPASKTEPGPAAEAEPARKHAAKAEERGRHRSETEKKPLASEPAEEKLPAPRSAPPVTPSDSEGVLSILVPPNAAGPVSIEVDKRARGLAPLKIKLGPGLHELVQSYQGKRSMRIVLIRAGKTKIVTVKIPD